MSTNEPTLRKPIRLWPGVVIAVLMLLARVVVPLVYAEGAMWSILGTVAGGALIWFLVYARVASRAVVGPQRGVMIVRALVKIALGWAVWAYMKRADLSGFEIALRVVAVWCVATGAVQLLLMLWGGRSHALGRIIEHIEQRTGEMRPARRRSF